MCCYYRILFLCIIFIKKISSCENLLLINQTFGHVENLNFFLGKSQPKNQSCSWKIQSEKQSGLIVSLRIIEIETNKNLWSNELILKTDIKQILINDINQRTFFLPSSSNFEIDFPIKSPISKSYSLNIHRFLLEFIQMDTIYKHNNNFHCTQSGLIIPKQWKCNCLQECGLNDISDEDDCSLCSMIKSSNSLLCHSNEIWCLPVTSQTDSKGVCIQSEQIAQCSYSMKCETIITYYEDHGEILLNNNILSNRESLCFVIIAKENHQLRLIINQYDFIYQRSDLEYFIYDGDQKRNQLLTSSNSLLTKQIVQTRENHISTILIRKKHSIENEIYDNSERTLLNITWLTSICLDNQFLCGGHFEKKCYSKQQRCDGIWDCISGDDELGCLPSSCPTTFACYNQLRLPSDQPRCYNWYERCNGNGFCPNHTDERNCTSWWCNSNNGTFLCKNQLCIYETWVCDGTDDCGDNSDEIHCSSRIPRRIMTAIVIGATICSTLFLIALGCTCKLVHLRTVEQQTSNRLFNSPQSIEQQCSNDSQRVAPPTYNQTMGFSNHNDDRHEILVEQLRLAGLTSLIPTTRSERRRNHHQDFHDVFIESQSSRFNRFCSLFTRNLSINNNNNNNSIPTNDIDISQHRIISSNESRELPPPYSEERLLSPSVTMIENIEQANSDDDDGDDKMLVP